MAGELDVRGFHIDARRALEDLNDSLLPLHFKNLTAALRAIR